MNNQKQQSDRVRGKLRCGGFKRAALLLLLVLLSAANLRTAAFSAYAAEWIAPEGELTAGAAIVMDADTGTVLWGSNIYEPCYPASVTKVMTVLLALERCDMDEMVEITADSVYGLESGAITAGLSVGDLVSVRDLVYATLFRSAADSSNALAIHISGSISAFAEEMTKRAEALGCPGTVFKNPSGLTDSEHTVTAYGMALIGQACFHNTDFMHLFDEESYRMGPTEKYPDGLRVTVEHKMIKSGTAYTDERAVGGKTGFIRAAGNTLITLAEEGDRHLVIVVLKDKNPEHYLDTKLLMDFGFAYFENRGIPDPIETFDVEERLRADKIISGADCHILADGPAVVTVPRGALDEEIVPTYDYNLTQDEEAPELAVGKMIFRYADVRVGSVYILNDRESRLEIGALSEEEAKQEQEHGQLPLHRILIGLGIVCILSVIGLAAGLIRLSKKREEERRSRFQERRKARLQELSMTEEEFHALVGQRKNREEETGKEPEP